MIDQLKGEKDYTLVKELHRGGFGITYLASGIVYEGNIPHKCSYTIKELFLSKYCQRNPDNSVSAPSDEAKSLFLTAKKKFLEEAKILQGLKHPNIVPVNEVFEQNGTAYYVMEYLGDTSLQQYVHQQGERLSEQEAINIINSLCNAVKYLHGKGILHLDIKPDNIMIFNGQPYLIDFGQALFFKSGKATSHSHIGGYSKGFSSAELRQGTVDSFRTDLDIYSVAATLYYMLTGKTPDEATSITKRKIYAELPDNTEEHICEVIAKAMSPDISERPADIGDFIQILNGGSITDTIIIRRSLLRIILTHIHNTSVILTIAGVAAIAIILSILWPITIPSGKPSSEDTVVIHPVTPESIKDTVPTTSLQDAGLQEIPADTLKTDPSPTAKPPTSPKKQERTQPADRISNGTLHLGYAVWTGGIKNGKPNGEGSMRFTRTYTVEGCQEEVCPGDYIQGYCEDGILTRGRLYRNGELIETFIQ